MTIPSQGRILAALLIGACVALPAADPLLTDARLVIGSGQRNYSVGPVDDEYDRALSIGLQFVYGFRPMSPHGTWFVGGMGRFFSEEDNEDSDGFSGDSRRFMIDAMAGYAYAPPEATEVHVELGPYAGVGLAKTRFVEVDTTRTALVPALEGGVRLGAYWTWNDVLQGGFEADYAIALSRQSVTSEGSRLFVTQGFSLALGVGMRIH